MSNRPDNGLHGMLMYPCSTSMAEHKRKWKNNSLLYTNKNFKNLYEEKLAAQQHIVEHAKIYIIDNWKKVKDYSKLNVVIRDNTGKHTEYYNYIPSARASASSETVVSQDGSAVPKSVKHASRAISRIFARIEKENEAKHNPIISFKDVVLDTSDGDFSLTINGHDHLWIDGESVIIIADYIEKMLRIQQKENRRKKRI